MKIFINNTISIIIFIFIVSSISVSPLYSQITDLNFETIDGKLVQLSDYTARGPVYMSFWALWCKVCKEELRVLNDMVEKHSDKSFTLLAINLDSPKSLAKVKAYIKSQGFVFPVILDPNEQIFQSFNGQHLPFAVLLDTNGNTVSVRTGYLPGEESEIEEEILKLVSR